MEDKTIEEYFDLWMSLYRARDFIFALRKRELAQHGISPEQSAMMWAIDLLDNRATNKDISQYTFRKRHSVYEMIRRMKNQGLVQEVEDTTSNGSEMISLTPEGQKRWKNSRKGESIKKIFSILTEEECQQLLHCLEKLQNEAIRHISLADMPPLR